MPNSEPEDAESSLPEPGSRSGVGAQSVLPYLTKTLQARPAAGAAPEARGDLHAPASESVFARSPPSPG